MRFLMLVCRDEAIAFAPEDRGQIGRQVQSWVDAMQHRGARLLGEVLAPIDEATTVSVREGETLIAGRPRADDLAPASGFNLIECRDLDEAVEVSAQHPIARYGVIELRRIED